MHRDTSNLAESTPSNPFINDHSLSFSSGNSVPTQTEGPIRAKEYENLLCTSFRDLALQNCTKLGFNEMEINLPPQSLLFNSLDRSPYSAPTPGFNGNGCENKLDRILAFSERSHGEVSSLVNKICLLEGKLDQEVRNLSMKINDLNGRIYDLNGRLEISTMNDQFNWALRFP